MRKFNKMENSSVWQTNKNDHETWFRLAFLMSVMHFLYSSLDKGEMYEENVKRRGGGITEEKKIV